MAKAKSGSAKSTKKKRGGEVWQIAIDKLPVYIPGDPPYRPSIMIVADGDGLVVGFEVYEKEPVAQDFSTSLRRIMSEPMAGDARKPTGLVVSDAALALPLATALEGIEVTAGETAEAWEALEAMAQSITGGALGEGEEGDDDEPTTFVERDIEPADMARLFTAGARLWRAAPWTELLDVEVLGIDVPEAGIERGCLSVLGEAEEVFGFVLFQSADAFRRFHEEAQDFEGFEDGELPQDLGPPMLSLTYDPIDDLPGGLVQEIEQSGWEVTPAKMVPGVLWVDGESIPMPHRKREVAIVTACADALAELFEKNREAFETGEDFPHVEAEVKSGDLTVRIRTPHPELSWAETLSWYEDEDEAADDEEAEDPEEEPRGGP